MPKKKENKTTKNMHYIGHLFAFTNLDEECIKYIKETYITND